MPSRKHRNTLPNKKRGHKNRRSIAPCVKEDEGHLPNKKRGHKNRRSIAPCVKEDEGHCISGCHHMLIMCSSFIKRLIKMPFIIPLKITWWIYGTVKYLLLYIVWPLQYICSSFCCDKTTVTEHLTQSTPTSDDDSLLGNSQEQEMLQLRKDNAYYKEAYEQEKRTRDNEAKRYEYQLDRAKREINDLRKSKDDALSRLSAMMGAKLRDNNPAITDLNDPNRPMKIGEKFSGVYENEWTDAFLNLQDMKSDVNDGTCIDEEEAIAILLNILRLNEKSILESDQQLSTLLQPVLQGHSQDMSSEVTKSTKDTHKANAVKYIPVLYKKITREDSQCKTVLKYTNHCQSYIESCLKVCYFASVQDPPMFLEFEPGEDTFDRQVYKEYTQMGTKVKFLVWPALFLHKGGALISKGVLQPIPDTN